MNKENKCVVQESICYLVDKYWKRSVFEIIYENCNTAKNVLGLEPLIKKRKEWLKSKQEWWLKRYKYKVK